jgi:hypothetical protein
MTDSNADPQPAPEEAKSGLLRKIIQWTILALLLFTCIMAAVRKFG